MSQPVTRPDPTVPPGGDAVTRELPPPLSLRRMVGPGVVAVGIGMAAGEIILWPYLTAIGGLGLLWLAFATLAARCAIGLTVAIGAGLAIGARAAKGLARLSGLAGKARGAGIVALTGHAAAPFAGA